jgi:hypothetical protein
MSDGMGAVLAAIADLAQQFEQRFGKLEQRVDGLAEDLTRLRVDVMARLDRQQDMLASIRDDVGVNMAATDQVREANLETRKDLQQLSHQVSVIHRRLIQLEERVDRQGGA